MVTITRFIIRVLSLLVISGSLVAQSIKVNVPKEYESGRPFNITYTITNTPETPQVLSNPNLSGLELLYGPVTGSSSSTTIINGRVNSSSQSEVTYTVMAEREGSYKISGLRIKLGNKEIAAPSASIQIHDSGVKSGQASASSHYNNYPVQASQAQYKYQAIVSKRSVYVQEALPIIYKLLSTESPRINGTKPSTYDGFVSLDLLGNAQRQLTIERVGGRDWASVEVMKELLFAQHAGQLTIPENELPVLYTIQDPSGDPFLSQTSERILRSSPITINVKPLPEEGKPTNFSGAVGSFKARYEVESKIWKTNEATTLKVILEGQGNLKIAKLPQLEFPNYIELYDPTEKSEQKYEGEKLHSERIIEYSLIPRNIGQFNIPEFKVSYFNPNSGQYETTSAPPITIDIVQGKATNQTSMIHTPHQGEDNSEPFSIISDIGIKQFSGNLWLILLVHSIMAFIGGLAFYAIKKYYQYTSDTLTVSANRANTIAVKRLHLAKQHLERLDQEKFLEETLKATWGYLGDKLKLSQSMLSRENICGYLQERGIQQDALNTLVRLIDSIEFARFAPAQEGSLDHIYEQAIQIITELENNLK